MSPPKTVLLVMKWGDPKTLAAGRKIIESVAKADQFALGPHASTQMSGKSLT